MISGPTSMRWWLGAATIGFLVAGCNSVDLSAVRDFAAQTTAAKQSFDDLAGDWLGTCVRRTEYARKTRSDLRLVPADPNLAGNGQTGDCASAAAFAKQWQQRNDVVIAYVRALGGLAGVGSVPKNTDTLAAGLSDVSLLPASDKSAFADLVGKIASAAVENRQRNAIGDFAKQSDGSLRVALSSLHFFADRYDAQLSLENDSLDQMYRDTLRAQTSTGTDASFEARRLRIAAERAQWEASRSDLRQQHQKTAAYRDALDTIGKSHAEIVARANRFGPADLAAVLKGYADEFRDDVTTLSKPAKK
jgi:hypothetical protein